MSLTSSQKKYIKAEVKISTIGEISEKLNIPEKEIRRYLKKIWRPEKYKKITSSFLSKSAVKDFDFNTFFIENKFIFLLLFVLVTIIYTNSLGNALVSDDVGAITGNPNIGNFSNISFGGIIQKTIYFFVYKVFGTVPMYYRIFNVFFHLSSVFLIFIILSLISNKKIALFAAALFAVHPMLIESVAWISGHPYAQSSFFFLLSFFFYLISGRNKKYLYFSIAAFLLSLSASEKSFVLFLIFPLYEFFYGDLKENWKRTIPYFAVSLLIAVIAISKVGYRVDVLQSDFYLTPGKDSLFIKIPTSVASYFGLIFWPDKLSLYHTEMVFSTLEYWITVLVFLIYLGIIIYAYFKNQKAISFWLIFFLIPLAPTLSPLRIAWAVAERYAYLSTLGIIFLIAWILYKISEKEKFRTAAYVVFWIVIGLLSIRTIIRNTDWKNEENLWLATVKTSPSGPNIHNNLGAIYQGKGDYQKAIDEFQLAIKINPAYADAYHNIGNTYYSMQKYDEAEASYRKATELNLKLWQSHQNLAAIYYAKGMFKEAKAELEQAKALNPTEPSIQQNLELLNSTLQMNQNLTPVSAPQQ